MTFNTDGTKPLCNIKAQKDMAIVNKQRNKSSTDSKYIQTANLCICI